VQAHPEFVPEIADQLLAGRVELIGADRVAVARESLQTTNHRHAIASWIAAFLRAV
ncbi:MAG: hypothetical protein JWO36_6947, partial [Myxococcales bacterium]|nr:hypothetical protein [Myxococcales bacterium]